MNHANRQTKTAAAAPRRRQRAAALAGALLVGAAALLSACGFQPVYGERRAAGAATLATIEIDRIEDRSGQQLRTLLRTRLTPRGQTGRPQFRLSVTLTESKSELAIRRDESATRANLTLTTRFTLTRLPPYPPGSITRTASSTNSYNVLDSEFATLSAENDARKRALRSLAEAIRIRIATAINNPTVFNTSAPNPPPETSPETLPQPLP